jgi:hypothetical protein
MLSEGSKEKGQFSTSELKIDVLWHICDGRSGADADMMHSLGQVQLLCHLAGH